MREEAQLEIQKNKSLREVLQTFRDKSSRTSDGTALFLEANIGSREDLPLLAQFGCEGIGLFRTEFLFLDRDKAPTEEEQYSVYRAALEACAGHETVIRTLDVGGDKQVPYIPIGEEDNPFLGLRAVRYCLKDKTLFKIQLRALLRASAHGPLSIMFPMISGLEEIVACKKLIEECRAELGREKIAVSDEIRIGIMIEIPSAAYMAQDLIQHVDFFSIGTNDLVQYMVAADRMNEKVADLYENLHPAVLRMVAHVITSARAAKKPVAVCGEMAADPSAQPLLLGMGLRTFSQNPSSVLKSRQAFSRMSLESAERLWDKVSRMGYIQDIRGEVKRFVEAAAKNVGDPGSSSRTAKTL
jgi:phosphotransferase system enzyme I (PtsI)